LVVERGRLYRGAGFALYRAALPVRITPKSCVYIAPDCPCASELGGWALTPIAVSLKWASRMFARCSGEAIHACTIARGVDRLRVPHAMFSPTS
jgi:hypothetical protein